MNARPSDNDSSDDLVPFERFAKKDGKKSRRSELPRSRKAKGSFGGMHRRRNKRSA